MNGHATADTGRIPHVDISSFGDEERIQDREQAAAHLRAAASRLGSVAITGHGIAPERLQEAFDFSRRLYGLSTNEKLQARRPDSATHHRGYSVPGRERTAALESTRTQDAAEKARLNSVADYKESYEIGSEQDDEQPNIWLPEHTLPGFRSFTTNFYWELFGAARRVLEALIHTLDLTPSERDTLRKMHGGHSNQMRLAHYLPVMGELAKDENTFRLAAHRDFSSFTCLFQDGEHSGLEFQDPTTGEWMLAPPTSGVLYLNIGDIFDRLSNGRFPSSLHRVIAPLGKNGREATTSRYSIVLFVSPKGSQTIEPLESLVKADGKQVYEPMTFMDYCVKMYTVSQTPG